MVLYTDLISCFSFRVRTLRQRLSFLPAVREMFSGHPAAIGFGHAATDSSGGLRVPNGTPLGGVRAGQLGMERTASRLSSRHAPRSVRGALNSSEAVLPKGSWFFLCSVRSRSASEVMMIRRS